MGPFFALNYSMVLTGFLITLLLYFTILSVTLLVWSQCFFENAVKILTGHKVEHHKPIRVEIRKQSYEKKSYFFNDSCVSLFSHLDSV